MCSRIVCAFTQRLVANAGLPVDRHEPHTFAGLEDFVGFLDDRPVFAVIETDRDLDALFTRQAFLSGGSRDAAEHRAGYRSNRASAAVADCAACNSSGNRSGAG